MFLPILLLRDFGLWGFLVFAVPNVLGAGAMGWVLWRDGASETMAARHRTPMLWFTSATLGFHVYWLAWLVGSAPQWLVAPGWPLGLGGLLGLVVAIVGAAAAWERPARWATVAAPLTLAVSLIALAMVIGLSDRPPRPSGAGGQAPEELLWLAPVTVFGFALCPYLDLTFHRARQALPARTARLAFTVGFGLFFAAMITLTVLYAGWLAGPLSGGGPTEPPVLAIFFLSAHVVGQATFTVLAHASAAQPGREPRGQLPLMLWVVVVGPAAAVAALSTEGGLWGLSVGELIYRSFMGLYGLAFPAYVWLVMIPTGREPPQQTRPGRGALAVWAVAVAAAAPFFSAGFLARESHWLVAGMAIVLAARFAGRPFTRGTRTAPASE